MRFTPHTSAQKDSMCDLLGIESPNDLYSEITEDLRSPKLAIEGGMGEPELAGRMRDLSDANFSDVSKK